MFGEEERRVISSVKVKVFHSSDMYCTAHSLFHAVYSFTQRAPSIHAGSRTHCSCTVVLRSFRMPYETRSFVGLLWLFFFCLSSMLLFPDVVFTLQAEIALYMQTVLQGKAGTHPCRALGFKGAVCNFSVVLVLAPPLHLLSLNFHSSNNQQCLFTTVLNKTLLTLKHIFCIFGE